MWLFYKRGFVSVVEHKEDAGLVMIRARVRDDLVAFRELLPSASEVVQVTPSDYAWRCTASKSEVAAAVAQVVMEIDYTNFKSAVHGEPDRDRAYMEVWGAMNRLQYLREER